MCGEGPVVVRAHRLRLNQALVRWFPKLKIRDAETEQTNNEYDSNAVMQYDNNLLTIIFISYYDCQLSD